MYLCSYEYIYHFTLCIVEFEAKNRQKHRGKGEQGTMSNYVFYWKNCISSCVGTYKR